MKLRCAMILLAGLGLAPNAGAQNRTDNLGDPLPAGAVARLGTLRFKHLSASSPFLGFPENYPSTISKAIFSPDGKRIISLAGTHGTICLWDALSGKKLPGPWNVNEQQHYHTAVAFSADGTALATAFWDEGLAQVNNIVVAVWDLTTGKALWTMDGLMQYVDTLAFADDGKTLVAAGMPRQRGEEDVFVRWWDISSGKELRTARAFADAKQPLEPGGGKSRVLFSSLLSPGAKYLAVHARKFDGQRQRAMTLDEGVVFDLTGGKEPWRVPRKGNLDVLRFGFSADARLVALTVAPDRVELRDSATGKLVATPTALDVKVHRTDFIGDVALSADGSLVAVAGKDSTITVWSTKDTTPQLRRVVGRIAQPSSTSTQALAFSADGKTLLAGADSDLQLYHVATLKEVVPWDGHRGWIDYVAFSDDGQRLFTGSAQINLHPKEVATWDTSTWQRLSMTSNRTPRWPTIGIPSPEHTFYAGRGDDRYALYDFAKGEMLARFHVPKNQPAEMRGFFAPGSKLFVLGGTDERGKPIERVYAVPSAKLLCQLPAPHPYQVDAAMRPIAFSPDGRLAAVFDQDNTLSVFDMPSGKLRHRLYKERVDPNDEFGDFVLSNLAFSSDGALLASWTPMERAIRIWDTATGKVRGQLLLDEGRRQHLHFAWSPDGRTLAVADKTLKLWEVASRRVRRELVGHASEVRAMAFSPDGRLLASGSADTTVLIWDVWGQ